MVGSERELADLADEPCRRAPRTRRGRVAGRAARAVPRCVAPRGAGGRGARVGGAGSPVARADRDRRARARARRDALARRGRVRSAHLPVRAVRVGKDVRARCPARAAPAGDQSAHGGARPELRLRAHPPRAGWRRADARSASRAGDLGRSGAPGRCHGQRAAPAPLRGARDGRGSGGAAPRPGA